MIKFIFFTLFSFFFISSCKEECKKLEKLDINFLNSLSTKELMIELKNYFENSGVVYQDQRDLEEQLKIESENQKTIRKTISNRINSFYEKFINDNIFEEKIKKNIDDYNSLSISEKIEKYFFLYNNIFSKKDFYEKDIYQKDKLIVNHECLIYNLRTNIVEILFKRSAKFLAVCYFLNKLKVNTKYLPEDLKDSIDNFNYEKLLEKKNGVQSPKEEEQIKFKFLLME